MSGFLLDTNCISEITRPHPEPLVTEWFESTDETLLYLSVLTLGEIRKGVAGLGHSKRRSHLETWLEVDLQVRFAGRILAIDAAITDRWGLLTQQVKDQGKTLAIIDGLLAATAIHHNLTVVSRNARDFPATHVSILNPWEA